jgi:4a-hydroxytetrahydrobiopterin dehydratase
MTVMLAEMNCTPCRGGIPPLGLDEAREYLAQAPAWTLLDDGHRLERTFWFTNFRAALDFVRDVGELAEAESHHPDIAFVWGRATISLQTKKIHGLHQNDFIMATRIDRIAQAAGALESQPQRGRSTGSLDTNQPVGSRSASHS